MKTLLYCAVLITALAFSCGRNKEAIVAETKQPSAGMYKPGDNGAAKQEAAGLIGNGNGASDTTSGAAIILQSGIPAADPDWDKKIIRTANVTLELKDYNLFNTAIRLKVKSFGAYIAEEQQSETDDEITNDISIKVPVDRFEDLMNSLGGDGIKIVHKNISSEDVTGEVVDTKARLEAKKQVRDRYMDLLKQAKSMRDILDVQEQINSIQEDIESSSGRVNYLVHSAAYSTVNIKYYQFLNGVTQKEVEPGFGTKILEAFKSGGEIITNIILFFANIWPLFLAAVIFIFYIRKGRKNKTFKTELE
ncbi:MAG TPA: DUF4349 domain-containing protein [Chitinophagaceae bacterium]|nr:DUF4349 domain-containing protein [Chitinophagaceae bacterium]